MVGKLLGIKDVKIAEDAADALAVALCCLIREKSPLNMSKGSNNDR
jgi:Holliday junction resolvasome RuvABC endonuclease subunit